MSKLIFNKKGSGYVGSCVLILVLAMIFTVVLIYANVMTIVQTTKDNTKRVLDSFVMKNSVDIFESIKQGNDFIEDLENLLYISLISSELSLDKSSNMLYSENADGEIVYTITNPNVTYEVDNALKLKASYDLTVPMYFAGSKVLDLKIPVVVNSSFTLKE